MPLTPATKDRLTYDLGEFTIGIEFVEIESYIVERARKKLERRTRKQAKNWSTLSKRGGASKEGGTVYEFDDADKAGTSEQRDDEEMTERVSVFCFCQKS